MMELDEIDKSKVPKDEMQDGGLYYEDPTSLHSKKLQDDLQKLGMKIQLHEDNIRFLGTLKDKLVDSIIDLQVTLRKYHASSTPRIENKDDSDTQSEDKPSDQEQIIQQEHTATSILCHLKTNPELLASDPTLSDDVLGVVAELGKVDDSRLSRLLSEYLGKETMLAIVCKTNNGVKSLEKYDEEGCINKTSGLHGFFTSLGKTLEGRFNAISLETLRPYSGEFVVGDLQRKLDIPKPRLPNGNCPAGFIGYAVNMMNIDRTYLFFLTTSGYGLRETLFYSLLSCLQVYKTRAEMLQAIPCITDGALSLDGEIIKRSGLFCLGNRDEVKVIFSKPSTNSILPDHYMESERQMKEMKWKKEKMIEDMRREQALLDSAKLNFKGKKAEFVQFLAETAARTQKLVNLGSKTSVPQLTEENFLLWKFQVLLTLRGHELQKFIDVDSVIPGKFFDSQGSSSSECTMNSQHEHWIRQDKLIRTWLLGSMSSTIVSELPDCNSSREKVYSELLIHGSHPQRHASSLINFDGTLPSINLIVHNWAKNSQQANSPTSFGHEAMYE